MAGGTTAGTARGAVDVSLLDLAAAGLADELGFAELLDDFDGESDADFEADFEAEELDDAAALDDAASDADDAAAGLGVGSFARAATGVSPSTTATAAVPTAIFDSTPARRCEPACRPV